MEYKDLIRGKDYEITELLDFFGPNKLAKRIEAGDFFKTNIGTYRVLE